MHSREITRCEERPEIKVTNHDEFMHHALQELDAPVSVNVQNSNVHIFGVSAGSNELCTNV